jgi:hypothetical protein
MASRFELHVQIYEAIMAQGDNTGRVDRAAFAQNTIETSTANYRLAAETPLADDPRIQHLLYKDFTADPVGVIRGVYDRAGLAFTKTYEAAMRRWMAENPPNKYGRFAYSPKGLSVDLAALDRQLDPYRERFGVPREHAK